jgi:hypothetical protein
MDRGTPMVHTFNFFRQPWLDSSYAHSSTLPLKGIGFAKYWFQPLQDRYPTCLIQSKIIVYKRSWHLFPSPTFATCPSPTFHTLDGNVWRGGFYTRKTGLWFLYCHFFFSIFWSGMWFVSGYTYMVVWVGGLEVWEIRVLCNIHYKIWSIVRVLFCNIKYLFVLICWILFLFISEELFDLFSYFSFVFTYVHLCSSIFYFHLFSPIFIYCHLYSSIFTYLSINLSIFFFLSLFLSFFCSFFLSIDLSIHLSIYLSIYLSVCLSGCLSNYL